MVAVGDRVEDFTLKDHTGQDFSLSSCRGRKVLLSFHPLAWTSVCTEQITALEQFADFFKQQNTMVVSISVDSVPCKKAWAERLKIAHTPLLADFWPHGELASRLGIFREKDGFSERANIILDEQGIVSFVKLYAIPQKPDIDEVLKELG
jgi:peroxiredoxin